jgi:N-acetylglucosaminyldiphosphoundecaprenol N-acetyl-beta-D-mannosaminyltransferase
LNAIISGNPVLLHNSVCRVAGVDVFQNLVKLCADRGYKPFFFGAREWVVKKVVDVCRARCPNPEVAGYRNGYYSEEEESGIAEIIHDSRAEMLFLGFSSPMKEKFLNQWMPMMQVFQHSAWGVGHGAERKKLKALS